MFTKGIKQYMSSMTLGLEIAYDACFACLLWGNASFMISPVATPHGFGFVPFKVLCGKCNETLDKTGCFG